ncbi:porin [Vibrio hippocampi]|uniref:Porin-like protein L n=1 Tax=Vibrio hippocampi TaxID=654686 RepID=A0ABN8DIQ2_9VIBR|nr:porin [Vibrio hippocampi]CAH0528994.1 Porin-like protein L [Vibrio hippocampi]
MKMTAIATAMTTLITGSALAAEVYNSDGTSLAVGGRAEFRGDFAGKDSGEELDGTMNNKSRFRLNADMNTSITSDLDGFAFYEAEQTVNSSSGNDSNTDFKQRYMYVGLSTNGNSVSFGRQDTAVVQISQMSDISTYSGDQKAFIDAGNEQINNTFLYTGEFMDSLTIKADYVASDEDSDDSYGISGVYVTPIGLGVGLGYAAGEVNGSGDTDQFIAGLNYTWEDLYLAGTYTTGSADDDANLDFEGYEFAASYSFASHLTAILVYGKQEIDDEDFGKRINKNDYVELTGVYKFNRSLRAYLSYKMNMLEADDWSYDGTTLSDYDADDSVRLGLRYDF